MLKFKRPRLRLLAQPQQKIDSYNEFVTTFHQRAFHYAYWIVKDTLVAEEVVKLAFGDLYKTRAELNEPTKAICKLIKLIKMYANSKIVNGVKDLFVTTKNRQPILSQLQEILHDMSLEDIEPLILQIIFGLNTQHIATQLNIDENTVVYRLCEMRTIIKERLDDTLYNPLYA